MDVQSLLSAHPYVQSTAAYEFLLVGRPLHKLQSLATNLQRAGLVAVSANSLEESWEVLAGSWRPDAIIIDLHDGHGAAINVARMIARRIGVCQILMLHAPAPQTIAALYQAGVDLVIAYPIDFQTFLAHLTVCLGLRRCRTAPVDEPVDKPKFKLNARDLIVLNFLWDRKGQILSPEELYRLIWQTEPPEPESMYNHVRILIHRLRKRLRPADSSYPYIQTIRGAGYMLIDLPPSLKPLMEEQS